MTVRRTHATQRVSAMRTGVILVNKPLCECEIVTAVCAAIALDRQQRLSVCRCADMRARFARLTPREKQVTGARHEWRG